VIDRSPVTSTAACRMAMPRIRVMNWARWRCSFSTWRRMLADTTLLSRSPVSGFQRVTVRSRSHAWISSGESTT